jgi:hypothetical protein
LRKILFNKEYFILLKYKPSVQRPVSFKELNGLLTAAKRVREIEAIVAIDVRPNTPPQTE